MFNNKRNITHMRVQGCTDSGIGSIPAYFDGIGKLGLAYYAQNFAYYAFKHCSKTLPIILNTMFIFFDLSELTAL